jgi:ATP-binding cassette, subfamily B, heavy metal transporter
MSFHKDHKVGGLGDHISKTSWQIASISQGLITNIAPQLLSVFVGIFVTYLINPIFTAILLIGIAAYLVALKIILQPTKNLLNKAHRSWSDAYGDAFQALSQVQAIKHMTAESHESERIQRDYMERTVAIWAKINRVWSNLNFSQRIIVLATQVTIFIVSVQLINQGGLTIGQLVALNDYAGLLFGPFIALGDYWQTLQNGLVSINQAEKVIFAPETEIYHPKNTDAPAEIRGEVEFQSVGFSYDQDRKILSEISFSVDVGEKIALVGRSGVGKSTIVDLLSGYYFPDSGNIRIDGHDTRDMDLVALRSQIAVVPQETALFNDTIMSNIRYGRLDASDEEVRGAARQAHAEEFILSYPKGYKQIVGERGVKLSVGQKQRIAIARAILRNPSILILDEPTSALDAATEKLITASFRKLMRGRTTFIVAHRLSTVREADRIIVLDNKRVAEVGTHDALIKKKSGIYRELYELQQGTKPKTQGE